MTVATTLDGAIDALQIRAIEPGHPWYVQPEVLLHSGRTLPPLARLKAQLLRSGDSDRFFVSGHIGSGKSTELKQLLAETAIRQRFYIVAFDVEAAARPSLTSHQLLFLIAAELYRRANEDDALVVFDKQADWQKILKRMDKALYGPKGYTVSGRKFGVEASAFFLKLKGDFSVDQGRREAFRKLAETEGSILVDLINALADDLASALVTAGLPHRVLVAIDDLEKLPHEAQLHEIFDTNLGALLSPRVPILTTVPPSVSFGGPGSTLGQRVTHLRPLQVLHKSSARDATAAADPSGIDLLRRILAARVDPSLFEPEVVAEAAVYSGGVIRDFFRLLRLAAIQAADLYGQTRVDAVAFGDVLVEETNNFTRTLYPADRQALREIRDAHALKDASQLDYMRRSVVLEYNHDGIWWEAAPMLWEWLEKT